MNLSILLQAKAGERVAGRAAEEFGKMDPSGIAMTVIAMTVVFVSLALLYLIFKYIAKLYNVDLKNRFRRSRPGADVTEVFEDIPGETLAAISLALNLYYGQMQDMDNSVITIKNVAKIYSPWSSKIYGLRKSPK